ncbi:hypothetical protein KI387_029653, partial [Taxus chinensis]
KPGHVILKCMKREKDLLDGKLSEKTMATEEDDTEEQNTHANAEDCSNDEDYLF